ncbi:hypothetical protein MmmBen181_1044 [Mycoplasma mycoides subsp. mycoides]|nr:hypothetical protein MMS_A1024 [Mycoplasma mycoides subsp. mycoides SC str. Gladysdale]AME11108.1 hypothetical protein MmmBen_0980 [Mycoplasma mycoides subsp. mycoides]AME12124.1 hypothetical protein MmmBen50_0967 [Mycoplasma mycoides subsp. mycoides]AME13165.1 hypothetical protein MmmBen181_1044 [Mycoplasma mycoides subsp. mycoides]AME15133.1 hypothetical protein MmmBen468_0939 [Mycoplasma mycoides subsp. mycoides]
MFSCFMLKLGNVGKEQQLEQVLEIENKLNQVRQKVEEFEKTFYSDEIKNQIDSQIKQFNDIFYKVTSNFIMMVLF